jgi:uncharacterized peroxidase-related enzyme
MEDAAADHFVDAIVRDWRSAPLSDCDRALCAFAVRLTVEQATVGPADLEELRAVGLDDRGIHDAVQVIGYFNYITRVASGLGVEPETFIRTWGSA